MLPTFIWSGENIDRLEQWWSIRIEQLIDMKQPLAASALFDEFQLDERSNFTHPGWLLIQWINDCMMTTVERLYGEDKKKALSIFYDNFCEEIDQLFFNKFQELSDLNVGEGETTRIVGRLLNAKTNVIDQIRGWRFRVIGDWLSPDDQERSGWCLTQSMSHERSWQRWQRPWKEALNW